MYSGITAIDAASQEVEVPFIQAAKGRLNTDTFIHMQHVF